MTQPCAATLGYDPQPTLRSWCGNPLPQVDAPLALTPRRRRVAERVYWQGPAWHILRNGVGFLLLVMDHASLEDARFVYRDVDAALWHRALDAAVPGRVSRGAYCLWSHVFGRDPEATALDWSGCRHLGDLRPRADRDRAKVRDIARRAHVDAARARGSQAKSPTLPLRM